MLLAASGRDRFSLRRRPRREPGALRSPHARRLKLESLEDRRLLSLGDLLATINDPSTRPQTASHFGDSVAVDGNFTVVGVSDADVQGLAYIGVAYVFDSTSGALVTTLANPTPAAGGGFGASVAVSGSIVVVGAIGGAGGCGSAYVYDAATGNLLKTLSNPTPAFSDWFGGSVAVSGSTVVVGAHTDDTGANNSGSAYVFDAATGNLVATLVNPTPAASDYFGRSVAVSGGTVVVGAIYDDTSADNSGSAYVFDAATGNLLRTLVNPTPAASDYFGRSVAVSGSTVVVGADHDKPGGSAYVFDAATGNLLRTLANPNPEREDFFGHSVAVSGSTVVVGTPWDDVGAFQSGSAYVFDAGTGNLLQTLVNPTPGAYDNFGSSVAVSGGTVVVGAYNDDTGATDSGLAYVYDAATEGLLQTLVNPTPAANNYLAYSMAVWGSTVVVGAYGDDSGASDSGSAYVYDAATGTLLQTLANPTPATGDEFGTSVAVSGSIVVVGAPFDDTGATDSGAAYVFDAVTGALLQTLVNPTPATGDRFGTSVAVSDTAVVVGAYGDDTGATDSGAAYVFDAATGNLLWTLNNPTPAASDYFGLSVAISGGTVVVGAYGDDTNTLNAGSAYVYDAASGNLLRRLLNTMSASGDNFGYSVAVSGSTIVVGAYHNDTGASNSGSAYVFDATTGGLLRTLANPAPAIDDFFGSSVAVSGITIVVGAPYDDSGATDSGSAHVFDAATGGLLWTLPNPTPAASDYFGCSAAVAAETILVGAYGEDGITTDRGAAYVFDNNTPTAVTVVSTSNPAVFGQSITLTATVSPAFGNGVPTGTVEFKQGTTVLGSVALVDGIAAWTTSSLTVARYGLTAAYSGDTDYRSNTSPIFPQVVTKASAAAVLTSSTNPSTNGQRVTFSATVTAVAPGAGTPGGTVAFKDGTTTLGTATLSGGTASFSTSALTSGLHSITAVYEGDVNFLSATSAPLGQQVYPGSITTLSCAPNPAALGQPVTMTATVTSPLIPGTPTGTVVFKDGATVLGSAPLVSATASFVVSTLDLGTHSITAVYGGDGTFPGRTSDAVTLDIVIHLPSDITLRVDPTNGDAVLWFHNSVTFGGYQIDSPGGQLRPASWITLAESNPDWAIFFGDPTALAEGNFAGGTTMTGTLSLGPVFIPGGICDLAFSWLDEAAAYYQSVVEYKTITTTTLGASTAAPVFGQPVTFTATVTPQSGSAIPSGTVEFLDGATVLGAATLDGAGQAAWTTASLGVGAHAISAAYQGNFDFTAGASSAVAAPVVPNVVTGLSVQKGAAQRSYLRYVDLHFAQAGVDGLIGGGRVRLTRYALDGGGPGANVALSGALSPNGHKLALDFGPAGLGGNPNGAAGDGYYELGLDLDGNGSFETTRHFYRLLGDLNGDRKVGIADFGFLRYYYGQDDPVADINGDGHVNLADFGVLKTAYGRRLAADLSLDD